MADPIKVTVVADGVEISSADGSAIYVEAGELEGLIGKLQRLAAQEPLLSECLLASIPPGWRSIMRDLLAALRRDHPSSESTRASKGFVRQLRSTVSLPKPADPGHARDSAGAARAVHYRRTYVILPLMKTYDFPIFLAEIQARKTELGIMQTQAEVEAMRNKGHARSRAKRRLLRAAGERAELAGLPKVKSYY